MTGSSPTPTIGIAIPAWRSAGFIAETLESALAQRGVDLTVTIGVDGADAETAEACGPYLSDSRVTLLMRTNRLGWRGNISATLTDVLRSGVAYAVNLPHDDIIEPNYLAALLEAHRSHPGAAVTYSDIQFFGESHELISAESVCGPLVARLEEFIRNRFNAVPLRGLIPTPILKRALPIPCNDVDDFGTDTVWVARLARYGNLVRVPAPLYRKRRHPDSTFAIWQRLPREQRLRA